MRSLKRVSELSRWSVIASAVVLMLGAGPRAAGATPILVAQAGGGVDLAHLAVNQIFHIDIVIENGAPGELGPGPGSGGGVLAGSFANLFFQTAIAGPDGVNVDLSTDPRLFDLTFQALGPGAGTIGVAGSLLNTSLGSFTLSSNLVDFTVLPEASAVPEPASMLLLGSGLAGLFIRSRRKKQDY